MITLSTRAGSIPVRSKDARIAVAPRSTADRSFSAPSSRPNGVRMGAAITTSSTGITPCLGCYQGSDRNRSCARRDPTRRHAALLEILLVVLLRLPEGGCRRDLGSDRPIPLCLFRRLRCFSDSLLFRGKEEDCRSILGAHIRALAVHLGWI